MNRTAEFMRFLIFASFAGCFLTAWPLIGQEATDAVQNVKIESLERRVAATEIVVASVNEKQTYILGGVAGMYALVGIIGIFNLRLIAKR